MLSSRLPPLPQGATICLYLSYETRDTTGTGSTGSATTSITLPGGAAAATGPGANVQLNLGGSLATATVGSAGPPTTASASLLGGSATAHGPDATASVTVNGRTASATHAPVVVPPQPPVRMRTHDNELVQGTTAPQNFGNVLVSLDFGLALALPVVQQTNAWFVPYVGASFMPLVLFPGCRTVDLEAPLTGNWRMCDRVAVSVGLSLTTPSVTNATVINPVFGRDPMFAAAFRLSTHTKVVAGTFLFELSSDDGRSPPGWYWAPFIAGAIDVDAFTLLAKGVTALINLTKGN